MKSPFVGKNDPNEKEGVDEIVQNMKSPFVEKCGAGGGVEVVPKMKGLFVEKIISDEKEGIIEIVPKMKRPFVEKRSGIVEVFPKMKSLFVEKEGSDDRSVYERLFSGK